jgi:hypothetical protein
MVGQRLRDICAARGLLEEWQRDAYLSRLHIMSWNDADVRACKKRALVRYSAADSSVSRLELFDRVSARLAVPGEPWSLIVVDTLARSARGEVEASAEAATDVIQEFEEWTQIAGNPTVVVLHHTRKSDANLDNPGKWLQSALTQDAVRGSSALAGAVRWLGVLAKLRIDVDSDKRTPSLPLRNAFFEVAKTNGAAEDAMSRLHLVPEERGVLRLAHELERAAWNECMQQPSKREKSSEPHGSAPPSRRTNGSSSQPRPFHDPRDTD